MPTRIMTRTLWGLVLASMALVGAHAAALASVTVLPGDTRAQLAISGDDAKWRVEPSHGGVLQLTRAQWNLESVDSAAVTSLQVVWTPPNTTSSPTFDHLVGTYVPGAYAAGVHVRASATQALALVEAESAVRSALVAISPALNATLVNGFLARSPCLSAVRQHDSTSEALGCFTASFAYQPLGVESVPQLEKILRMAKLETLRAIVMNVRTDSAGASPSVDALVASLSPGTISSESLAVSMGAVRIVTTVDSVNGDLTMAEMGQGTLTPDSLSFTPGRAVPADVSVSVLGEGFHRRVQVAIGPSNGVAMCPSSTNSSILLIVPLSPSVYADLDELRRMERFGELRLFSATKHIEIERPMAVSAQHTVVIEFPVSESSFTQTLEFPVHLRYQSPLRDSFYASAEIIAPDVYLRCSESALASSTLKKSSHQLVFPNDGIPIDWQRVVSMSPLVVDSVPVPVGFIPHGSLVSAITLFVTGLGSLLLVMVSTRPNAGPQKPQWKAKCP